MYFPVEGSCATRTPRCYDDGRVCPFCGGRLEFSSHTYGPFGAWKCRDCAWRATSRDYELLRPEHGKGELRINDRADIFAGIRTQFSVCNMLAACAISAEMGISDRVIEKAISGYALKNGRLRACTLGQKRITLLTSKHENSVSYDQSLACAVSRGGDVLIIVDAVSRKYFTGETSWLYDIDFSLLRSESIGRVYLAGKYVFDLAMRAEYAGIPKEKTLLLEDLDGISRAIDESENLYVITCFSDRDKFLSRLPAEAKEGEGVC